MKVATITFHTALNFGAVLQTYALFRKIKDKGHEVKVIDYKAPFNEKRFAPKSFDYFCNIRTLYGILFHNSYEIYYKDGFVDFLHKYLDMTSPVYNEHELSQLNSQFDTFITGSDQVWNLACTEGDEMYYLPWVTQLRKRNSYAASIGYTSIPKGTEERYRELMSGFNHISVREAPGVDIVKSLTGKDAELVLDPTLLLSKEQWESIADYSLVPSDEKYLLLYVMSEDTILIQEAKKYAQKHKLRILYISQRLFKLSGVQTLRNVTPEQWLGLFLKAEVVATNSFHGLAFSINFNRQFITRYIPRSIANSRMETLMNLLDLHYRRLDSDVYSDAKQICYNDINLKLQELRNKSVAFLDTILQDEE